VKPTEPAICPTLGPPDEGVADRDTAAVSLAPSDLVVAESGPPMIATAVARVAASAVEAAAAGGRRTI
jgi:hypothetical protein